MLLPRILPSCCRSAGQGGFEAAVFTVSSGAYSVWIWIHGNSCSPQDPAVRNLTGKCRAHSSALNMRGLMVSFDGPSSFADTDWTISHFLFFLPMSIIPCSPLCLSTEVADKNVRQLKAHQSFTCHFRKWTQGLWYINSTDFPLHFDSLLPTLEEIYCRILRK